MTLLSTRRIHTGRIVTLDLETVRLPNGTISELEMIRHPGASAVLPFLDPPDDPDPRVLLLHQYRHATGGYLWEIPAGCRDGDEDPEATARRELQEETGYQADHFERLTTVWTTPGFTDEVIHLFLATGLTHGTNALEADEVLAVHEKRWSEVMDMVRNGTLADTKSLNAILLVEAFHR